MILVDANLLIYAYASGDPRHEAARTWLDESLTGAKPVGLPWESLMAFVRITTSPRVFPDPAPVREAYAQVERWLAAPRAWIPRPTDSHATLVGELLAVDGLASKDIHDVHLAALAVSHSLRIASHDTGFGRFPAARWFDPLAD